MGLFISRWRLVVLLGLGVVACAVPTTAPADVTLGEHTVVPNVIDVGQKAALLKEVADAQESMWHQLRSWQGRTSFRKRALFRGNALPANLRPRLPQAAAYRVVTGVATFVFDARTGRAYADIQEVSDPQWVAAATGAAVGKSNGQHHIRAQMLPEYFAHTDLASVHGQIDGQPEMKGLPATGGRIVYLEPHYTYKKQLDLLLLPADWLSDGTRPLYRLLGAWADLVGKGTAKPAFQRFFQNDVHVFRSAKGDRVAMMEFPKPDGAKGVDCFYEFDMSMSGYPTAHEQFIGGDQQLSRKWKWRRAKDGTVALDEYTERLFRKHQEVSFEVALKVEEAEVNGPVDEAVFALSQLADAPGVRVLNNITKSLSVVEPDGQIRSIAQHNEGHPLSATESAPRNWRVGLIIGNAVLVCVLAVAIVRARFIRPRQSSPLDAK